MGAGPEGIGAHPRPALPHAALARRDARRLTRLAPRQTTKARISGPWLFWTWDIQLQAVPWAVARGMERFGKPISARSIPASAPAGSPAHSENSSDRRRPAAFRSWEA